MYSLTFPDATVVPGSDLPDGALPVALAAGRPSEPDMYSISIGGIDYALLGLSPWRNTTASGLQVSLGRDHYDENIGYEDQEKVERTGIWVEQLLTGGYTVVVDGQPPLQEVDESPYVLDTPDQAKVVAEAIRHEGTPYEFVQMRSADLNPYAPNRDENSRDLLTVTISDDRDLLAATISDVVSRSYVLTVELAAKQGRDADTGVDVEYYSLNIVIGDVYYGTLLIEPIKRHPMLRPLYSITIGRDVECFVAKNLLTRCGVWIEQDDDGFYAVLSGKEAFADATGKGPRVDTVDEAFTLAEAAVFRDRVSRGTEPHGEVSAHVVDVRGHVHEGVVQPRSS